MLSGLMRGVATVAVIVGVSTGATANHIPESLEIALPEQATEADIRERLEGIGFSNIENVSKEGQVFEADAVYNGFPVSLHYDVDTGILSDLGATTISLGMPDSLNVTFPESTSVTDVNEKLTDLGFTNIRNEILEGQVYEARAAYADRPVILRVDLDTGIINDKSRKEFSFGPPSDVNIQFPDTATEQDLVDGLKAIGYADVDDVRKEGQVFDARAKWHGVSYDLNIDAETGIIRAEPKK